MRDKKEINGRLIKDILGHFLNKAKKIVTQNFHILKYDLVIKIPNQRR